MVGVKIAGIADNLSFEKMADGTRRASVNFEAIAQTAAKTSDEAMRLSKALSLSPTGFVKAGEAALKMGLSAEKVGKLMEMSGAVHIQDREISQQKASEFLGTAGILFGAGEGGRDYNDDITKYANQWLGVANMTRTSASRLEEGLRQFAPLYASLGESFLDTSALVGSMTQAGLMDTESGTALKSMGIRMLNATHAGRDAMIVSGLWKEITERGLIETTGASARESLLNLKQVLPGQISKRHEPALRKLLEEGQKGGLHNDAGFQNRLFSMVNRITGAKDAPTREANQDKVLTAILKGGGKVQMTKILQLMAEMYEQGKLTDAQLAKIGEGRHLSRYKALFKMLPEFLKLKKTLEGVNDEFTEAGTKLWNESEAGRWEGAVAAVDRALVKLRGTEGVRSLTGAFEGIANYISDLPKGVQEFGGKALAASIGISALGLALGGVAKAVTLIAASPVARALLLGGAAAYATAPEAFKGFGDFGEEIPFGPGAPIWDTYAKMKALGSEMGGAFGDLSSGVGNVARELQGLMGMDPSASPVMLGLRAINAVLEGMTVSLRYWRTNAPLILGGKGAEAQPPGDAGSIWRRANEGYGSLMDGLRVNPPEMATGGAGRFAAPTGMLRELPPQRVDVHGQAEVKVQNEITVKVEGPGTVTDQRGGQGSATVPLNVGKTMPDAR